MNMTVHSTSQIFPMPIRLLVKFGIICPIRVYSRRWEVLITAVAEKILDWPLAMLTVMGCAVPSMLYTGTVFMKK